jgi:DNA-binding NarL/FixJ family response regulator
MAGTVRQQRYDSDVLRRASAKAVIVDHWPLVRLGLTRVLAGQDVRVVGEVDDAAAGIRAAQEEEADLLIVGQVRGLTPLEAVRSAKAGGDALRVLVLVGQAGPEDLAELLAAGADGLLGRMASPADVTAAVDQLLAGERYVAPPLLPALVGRLGPTGASSPTVGESTEEATLTEKERQVLSWLASGGTNVEIAQALYITPATVKTHVAHIYAKLGVKNRNAAISRALELGLLT